MSSLPSSLLVCLLSPACRDGREEGGRREKACEQHVCLSAQICPNKMIQSHCTPPVRMGYRDPGAGSTGASRTHSESPTERDTIARYRGRFGLSVGSRRGVEHRAGWSWLQSDSRAADWPGWGRTKVLLMGVGGGSLFWGG